MQIVPLLVYARGRLRFPVCGCQMYVGSGIGFEAKSETLSQN